MNACRRNVSLVVLLLTLLSPAITKAQTTIINPNNNTGTSGADGSFQNATSSFPANGWNVVNGATNRWFVGNTSSCVGTKGAYVSSHATGANNDYTNTTSDVSHFYKDVVFPAGQTCIVLSFNWKGQGESVFDGLKIFLGSTAVIPVGGTAFNTSDPSAVQLGNAWYNLQAACGIATITIPAANAGTTKRLVFSWVNDNSVGTNPAVTVDAVSLIAQNPTIPSCASGFAPANAATNVAICSTTLSWTAPASSGCNTATSYDVYFGTTAIPPFVTNTTATSYTPILNPGTVYYWRIVPKNAAGDAIGCTTQSFTTATSPNPQFSLVDDATSVSPFNCVTLTPDLMSQRGCAWDVNSTLNFLSNFQYEMDINLGNNDGGADGMAFVIHNDPLGRCKCGTVGGALGAGGILNSVTIEIDTYINFEDRDDFTAPFIGCAGTEEPDHLDVWFNGSINPDNDFNCDAVGAGERTAVPNAVRLQNPPGTNYNIENGVNHKLRINWNAGTSTLTATVLNSALTVTYGTISTTFNPITLFGTNTPFFGFTGSTGGLSNTQTFCLPAVLLPVDLIDFDVQCNNGSSELIWKTQSERNNNYFTVEKSCDGINFAPLKQINGGGNSYDVHFYSMQDASQCPGVNYYRLSQTDIDGTTKILGVRSIKACNKTADVLVFPNPADKLLTIAWDNNEVESMRLCNSMGQEVMRHENLQNGATTLELDVSGLAAGVYYLTVNQSFGNQVIKVTIE